MTSISFLCVLVTHTVGTSESSLAEAESSLAEAEALLASMRAKQPASLNPPPPSATVSHSASTSSCAATVTSLGCFAESWPQVYTRAYEKPGTSWRTMSPVECACMCRMRFGSDWTSGVVAIGGPWDDPGECGCHLDSSSLKFDARGAMPLDCCFSYDDVTETTALGTNNRCPKVERTLHNDPGQEVRGHPYLWVQKAFNVQLCTTQCSAATCPRIYDKAADWKSTAICASGPGARFHCNFDEDDGKKKIRIGNRDPKRGDVVLPIETKAKPYDAEWAKNWEAPSGIKCNTETVLAESSLRDGRKRGLDYYSHGRPAKLPVGTTKGEARQLVDASLTWMCEHASLIAADSFQCWTELAPGESAVKDCKPKLGADASAVTRLAQQCATDNVGKSRAERVARARRFLDDITANLAVDIVENMRGFCPDLDALRACVSGLLPTPESSKTSPFLSPPEQDELAIAFLIPYRERPIELRKWLWWSLPFLLQPSAAAFGIFVVEEINGPLWNKARILNAAIQEVRKLSPKFECFVFADVDLVMQATPSAIKAGHCLYKCDPRVPVHFSTRLRGYSQPYDVVTDGVFGGSGSPLYQGGQSSGGVNSLTYEQIVAIDGWTNDVWGWGGEDGDLDSRIKRKYGALTAPKEIVTYHGEEECVFVHLIDRDSDQKGAIGVSKEGRIEGGQRGSSGLKEVKYTLLRTEHHELYTKLVIDPLEKSSS